ncbi:triose-phosphate isomerase [Citrobacter amalonaticus]|uniref:Triosephosphate isomerase n=1 Tax=Citrobacter amalonaticus TaxID=35703 RepID=A0A2S4RVH1_CITAM|nr:triose-phosphate isomerase family protein [Citrobacter amalonaticus]POT55695.1 triose-phosphate isomerase [Citrobacter amalonaticus]POT73908.1 triose-phosphate isomerase [Citrobacter amalonaticus]POU64132.1 triose-phosphate isomerase [Citrobacter amalonaticus]POV03764.1 triose-phosphate isomerase [Citrobacter amalonaticus]
MPRNLILGVSHKTYFGYAQTQEWCQQVAEIVRQQPETLSAQLQLFTFPAMPAVAAALECFNGTTMATGGQNICAAPPGAWTGETSATMLQEMGCRYVELGHAERRRYFGETTEILNQKIDMALTSHLTPVICIGEEQRLSATDAAAYAIGQVQELLAHRTQDVLPPMIFAWEPQWAIGAAEPASDDYIRHVCKTLRQHLQQHYGQQLQVIYGGSAGPGLLTRLWPDVDGIFLGRFAHHPQAFASILAEAQNLITR